MKNSFRGNMNEASLDKLQAILGARLAGDAAARSPVRLNRVRIDSREVRTGDTFWALQGETRSGGQFTADAFARGAAGVVTDRRDVSPPEGRWALIVDDTGDALRQAASWQRNQFGGRVVAVTGSAGKTTARQMIDTVLASRFSGTASPRNYNNHLGVPLSMLRWQAAHDYAVVELGASARGEIAALCELARPEIGVITNIGDAHLGGFGGAAGVAATKAELLEALPADGLAVLNGDDRRLRRLATRTRAMVQWVGRGADCDLIATDVHSAAGRLSFTVSRHRYSVAVWGRHHLTAALTAVAVGKAFGLSSAEISDALGRFEPPPMRCQVSSFRGARLIIDAYNASPAAMRAALEAMSEEPAPGLRIVVCGDMQELGAESRRLHRRAGNEVVTVGGADVLVACGEHASDVVAGATAAGMPGERTIACDSAEEARPHLARLVKPGDVVLLKGSRRVGLERLVAGFEMPVAKAA
ncbi:MAG: UDP-N-acetylmuramoyl-tripeptide--D-alanyl-D-alanine ligase [Planctomycetia bacterium]|nr:UDP-N-acetylmuramoyl-tripeptide--D-alanyl-D-alanine ligase [Planctomycetia bacterium]